jgi:hypothetical protein
MLKFRPERNIWLIRSLEGTLRHAYAVFRFARREFRSNVHPDRVRTTDTHIHIRAVEIVFQERFGTEAKRVDRPIVTDKQSVLIDRRKNV